MRLPVVREPQRRTSFTAGDPLSGYYNDMTVVVRAYGDAQAARAVLSRLTADRRLANPVSIAQVGLGAWQFRARDDRWLDVVRDAVAWIVSARNDRGRIEYGFAIPHTYKLSAGWASAMAQGEAASLLVRAADALDRPELVDEALRVTEPLLDTRSELVATTPAGPVLQEYPTEPPAHVLNGWIFALWGLYDVAQAASDERRRVAFADGTEALACRLPLYSAWWDWSRYDLYPHRIDHLTTPFYHRLHIEMLRAHDDLLGTSSFEPVCARWERGLRNPFARTVGVGRKVAFRLLEPRRSIA